MQRDSRTDKKAPYYVVEIEHDTVNTIEYIVMELKKTTPPPNWTNTKEIKTKRKAKKQTMIPFQQLEEKCRYYSVCPPDVRIKQLKLFQ